ncbi:hypothetical protein GE21DRAFT_7158 [Neurospora crassa]|uniref:Uncharacterized protein n=1 Tax=Neurospora crassa (strain ATCC 24698 / 74-OR23-1A / CBS 708.71 / DSM 1257 / FGSC 987) TaxID=367110 RepID=Q7S726_NEUCR|nr:hypothetical protein NCU03583 [Neurospora crassa OR74A]EAA31339.1 hypothetical protein NCU03583 [Neurospora crassa OR74A]KHE78268.1 hypothetical protein GE21DRAFT_7158 [Neurospora crassa]|eukprot:XP_960575.1 hypothetical protein NCU03583 [Neurospora crassa OR74A]
MFSQELASAKEGRGSVDGKSGTGIQQPRRGDPSPSFRNLAPPNCVSRRRESKQLATANGLLPSYSRQIDEAPSNMRRYPIQVAQLWFAGLVPFAELRPCVVVCCAPRTHPRPQPATRFMINLLDPPRQKSHGRHNLHGLGLSECPMASLNDEGNPSFVQRSRPSGLQAHHGDQH